jgi:spermidine synthase
VTVQAGSAYSTPAAFWRTICTMEAAGLAPVPYHVHVPSFGDWGFALAQAGAVPPELGMSPSAPATRFLDGAVLDASAVFPADRPRQDLAPSTLDRPLIVEDMRAGYAG